MYFLSVQNIWYHLYISNAGTYHQNLCKPYILRGDNSYSANLRLQKHALFVETTEKYDEIFFDKTL